MPVEIRVPALGESVVDATVATWRKREGDVVTQGEVLVELETDKVNLEVSAEQSGVLQQIVKQQGETVGVGEVLAVIAEGASSAAAAQPAPAPRAAEPVPSAQQPAKTLPASEAAPQHNGLERVPSEPAAATPLARRIAAEHHVDLAQVKPEHGRVTKEDVLGYLEHAASPVAQPPAPQPAQAGFAEPVAPPGASLGAASRGREERVRMTRRRQTIAQRLVQAQHTAAMLTTFNEVDMSAIMEVRKRRKDSFKERYGVSLGFMSFFTRAVVGALKAFPRLNAEIQGDEMVLKHYYDIGIAVGAEEGLVVPVVRDADRKSFAEIEREIAALAQRARDNTLSLSDLQGGTFTITNGGVFGSLLSTPILNGPQVGILGMHKIEERPIALNGQVVIRPMMYLAVSYDHRIVDGREAVQFLVRVKELLEDPETLLLEG
jgi:2-oxoglutarate dehydrogenase E2 component (dihydrolipoamide succinyltransferase)